MDEINVEEEEVHESRPRKWPFIIFRWAILLYIFICLVLNFTNASIHIDMIYFYQGCSTCDFTQYEILILIVNCGSILSLFLATYLVLFQKLFGLRIYVMVYFLITWLQMLLTILMVQLFPLAYVVHARWLHREDISYWEIRFKCCGVLGPDDYLLNSMELPSSCFRNESMLILDLRPKGCLTRYKGGTTIFRSETLPVLFQFALVIMLLVYYIYLKKTNTPPRTLEELMLDHIVL